jgi:hypothetical protein
MHPNLTNVWRNSAALVAEQRLLRRKSKKFSPH